MFSVTGPVTRRTSACLKGGRRRLSNERGSVRAEIGFRSPPWLKAVSQHFGGDFSWERPCCLFGVSHWLSVAGLATRRDGVASSLGKFNMLDIVAWTSSQRKQRSGVLDHRLKSAGEQCDSALRRWRRATLSMAGPHDVPPTPSGGGKPKRAPSPLQSEWPSSRFSAPAFLA